jgi:hypothetical protein
MPLIDLSSPAVVLPRGLPDVDGAKKAEAGQPAPERTKAPERPPSPRLSPQRPPTSARS